MKKRVLKKIFISALYPTAYFMKIINCMKLSYNGSSKFEVNGLFQKKLYTFTDVSKYVIVINTTNVKIFYFRGFYVHSDIIYKSILNKPTKRLWLRAVSVDLDTVSKLFYLCNKVFDAFLH